MVDVLKTILSSYMYTRNGRSLVCNELVYKTRGHISSPRSDISNETKFYYENGNGVLKMINVSSENKHNGLVYMINE